MIASIFRTSFAYVTVLVATSLLGSIAIVAGLIRIPDRPGGVYDWVPRNWSKFILWAAGVKVTLHGKENSGDGAARVFVSNHLSWFDITVLAASLPAYKFVAKSELFSIPLFGHAMEAAGMISIERQNRKAAFESYKEAGEKIRAGHSVVVYPEGTRGSSYAVRSFKKGPFVLAIAAQVPIVPVIIHGTIEVMRKGEWRVQSGHVDVHLLDPVPTEGLGYDDRDVLADTVRDRMAQAMETVYGVRSSS